MPDDDAKESGDDLLPRVYAQLRAIAQQRLAEERAGHTLQATALVHEAYMRLAGGAGEDRGWANRAHFFAAAAEAMRRILIEHARARMRLKRGGAQRAAGAGRLSIGDVADLAESCEPAETIALDGALRRLQDHDPRAAEVVRLRFYAGLSVEQAAEVLGVSPRTVELDWAMARAWLFRAMRETDGGEGEPDGSRDAADE